MDEYKELYELQDLIKQFDISIEVLENKNLANDYDYVQVEISIKGKRFPIFVQDEFEDLKDENQPLCFCLVLLELEDYMEEDDYLTWCKSRNLSVENVQVRNYYMDLRNIYSAIEKIIGVIESPVSSFDFEMNTGVVKVLREVNT